MRRTGTPSSYDASFYRSHDALGYIPSDVQSLKSQATYASGLPVFTGAPGPFNQGTRATGGAKRSTYGSYASSVISQDTRGLAAPTETGSVVGSQTPSEHAGSIAYSQADRIQRRASFSSTSDMGLSAYEYKSNEDANDLDDMRSQYSAAQSGFTEF